ncbi:hypothetical protein OIU76_013371 [Salix suchowensis]|nr:hypothetical protein OIU76_013371 [Salix suchowensis]
MKAEPALLFKPSSHYTAATATATATAITSTISTCKRPVPHAPRLPPRGLDSATIKALPIALHKSNLGTGNNGTAVESECCICLGVFEDGDRLKVLPQCQHCFHCECVDNWLVTQSSCPLCRASVRADSAVLSIITE